MAGLPLRSAPSLAFHRHVIKHSTLGRHSKIYYSTLKPSFQHSKQHDCMLYWTNSYIGEKETRATVSSETFQIQLPALDCLFEKKCNPNYEHVRDESDAWMLSLFDPPLQMHDPQYVLYFKSLYSLFTSLMYPSCQSQRRLALLTKLTNWGLIYDDIIARVDLTMQEGLVHGLKSIFDPPLRHNYPECKQKKIESSNSVESACEKDKCLRVFFDRFKEEVWKVVCADMEPSICKRFVVEMESTLSFQCQHGEMRQKRKVEKQELQKFTLDYLIDLRVEDSFSEPLLGAMMEYALNIDLEDALGPKNKGKDALREKVDELKHVARRHTTWVNDFFSWRKEIFQDECISIVAILLEKRGVNVHAMDERGAQTIQEVIEEVWNLIKKQEELGASLLEEVKKSPTLDVNAHSQVVLYCQALCEAMAGNLYWSTLTARYNGLSPLPWNVPTSLTIPNINNFPTLEFLHL